MSKHKDVDTRSQCGGWVAPGRELFGTDHWCVYCGAKWSDRPASEIRTGSIASGTMRAVDRLPALAALADDLGIGEGHNVGLSENALELCAIASDASDDDAFADAAEWIGYRDLWDVVSEVTDELIDAIDEALPEGFHVGNHPGDPADLGLWAHCTDPDCDGWDECQDEAHYPAGHYPY